jgi:hypothetical protein
MQRCVLVQPGGPGDPGAKAAQVAADVGGVPVTWIARSGNREASSPRTKAICCPRCSISRLPFTGADPSAPMDLGESATYPRHRLCRSTPASAT